MILYRISGSPAAVEIPLILLAFYFGSSSTTSGSFVLRLGIVGDSAMIYSGR